MAAAIDGGEDYFCIDSKPIEICRPACAKRCSMGKNEIEKAPSFGYCASQGVYYYGRWWLIRTNIYLFNTEYQLIMV